MTNAARLLPAVLGVLALGAVGLFLERGAGAGDGAGSGAAAPPLPTTWVYDVRVVRVDPTTPATVEAAPSWQPTGATGATTKAPWADLLTGLKARGKTTILLDQRLTTMDNDNAVFRQDRKRYLLVLRNRQDSQQVQTALMDATYVETGTKGELLTMDDGRLRYDVEVRWEDGSATDGTSPLGSATWRGQQARLPAGETLVLPHRQQASGAAGPQELEIYLLVTRWSVPPK